MVLSAGIAYVIQNVFFRRNFHKGVHATVNFDVSYVEVGGSGFIKEVIENRKWVPLPVVHMSFRTGNGIQFGTTENISVSDTVGRRDIFSLLWHQRITRKFEFQGKKRGHYYIKSADVNIYNFLLTENYYLEFPQETELYVYPKNIGTERLNVLMERVFGFLQSSQKFYDDPLSYAGIREYTQGDEMKRINWKASAKSNELMVNIYDSVMAQKIMIFLDVSDKSIWKQPELIEEGISMVASLCKRLLKVGAKVSVCSNACLGDMKETLQISYDMDNQKIHTINRALCDIKLSGEPESVEEMFEKGISENCEGVFLLISKNTEDGYAEQMRDYVKAKSKSKSALPCMQIIPCHRSVTGETKELKLIEGVQQILWEVES